MLLPGPVPQFAPTEKFEYCEPEAKVIFANEVVYQVADPRGGYQLAVRQDRCIWNVEDTPNPTKAKDVPKKADSGTEKSEAGGVGAKATAQDGSGQNASAGQKLPAKAEPKPEEKSAAGGSSPKKTVGLDRVREWRAQVNDAVQKEANGSAPESSKKQCKSTAPVPSRQGAKIKSI